MTLEVRSLREWRRHRMLTAAELSSRAALSLRAYGAVERGESVPRFGTIRALSKALDIEPRQVREFVAVIDEKHAV